MKIVQTFAGVVAVMSALGSVFAVDAPQSVHIAHVPVLAASRGQPFPVEAQVVAPEGSVQSVSVFYTLLENSKPVSTPMKMTTDGGYAGNIPATFFSAADSFRYYIEVVSPGATNDTQWVVVKIEDSDREKKSEGESTTAMIGRRWTETTGLTPKTGLIIGGAVVGAGAIAVAVGGGGGGGSSGGGGGGFDAANTVIVNASGSASGGFANNAQDRVINGAGVVGSKTITGVRVTLHYDAYSIPDKFLVLYRGHTIAKSGLVSGSAAIQGTGSGDSPEVTIRVQTPQGGTAWNWSAKVEFSVK